MGMETLLCGLPKSSGDPYHEELACLHFGAGLYWFANSGNFDKAWVQRDGR